MFTTKLGKVTVASLVVCVCVYYKDVTAKAKNASVANSQNKEKRNIWFESSNSFNVSQLPENTSGR